MATILFSPNFLCFLILKSLPTPQRCPFHGGWPSRPRPKGWQPGLSLVILKHFKLLRHCTVMFWIIIWFFLIGIHIGSYQGGDDVPHSVLSVEKQLAASLISFHWGNMIICVFSCFLAKVQDNWSLQWKISQPVNKSRRCGRSAVRKLALDQTGNRHYFQFWSSLSFY